jgi:hypothetical protein
MQFQYPRLSKENIIKRFQSNWLTLGRVTYGELDNPNSLTVTISSPFSNHRGIQTAFTFDDDGLEVVGARAYLSIG